MKTMRRGRPVFIQTNTTIIVQPAATYTGTPLASRFSLLWFMPSLSRHPREDLHRVFAQGIADDLAQASLSLSRSMPGPGRSGFPGFHAGNAAFEKLWKDYKKKDRFVLNPAEYYQGSAFVNLPPIAYDVYMRDR